jgi:hypothetical protein
MVTQSLATSVILTVRPLLATMMGLDAQTQWQKGARSMQMKFGVINTNGTVFEGGSLGWSSQRVNVGEYRITFSPSMQHLPAVVATSIDDRNNTLSVENLGPTGFNAISRDTESNQMQDRKFSFVAVGS